MKKCLIALSLSIFLLLPLAALAVPYSSVIAFGDSLSDNEGGANPDGHGFGTWSNGPVWVEYLASRMNLSLDDYAYGGATSGDGYSNLQWQVDEYLANNGGSIASDALVTLWIGGNDFLNMTDPNQAGSIILNALYNTGVALTKLEAAGAKNILVLNLPDLGATPRMNWNPTLQGQGTYVSALYNGYLDSALSGLQGDNPDVNLMTLDVFGIMQLILANPTAYGLTNVTDYAYGAYPNYLFWDSIHPTTQAHELIANFAYQTVAPVPEPATMLLLGIGIMGIAVFRKRISG